MKYRNLGNTNTQVSAIGLGLMGIADLLYDVAFRTYDTAEFNYTTLQQFEDHYFEIPPPNYHWYQVTFIKGVIDVYNETELNFIREVKEKISWDKERTTEELLLELEEMNWCG